MATDRKHLASHVSMELYDKLERLLKEDNKSRSRKMTMSVFVGMVLAEYVRKEEWRLRGVRYSEDTDFG